MTAGSTSDRKGRGVNLELEVGHISSWKLKYIDNLDNVWNNVLSISHC